MNSKRKIELQKFYRSHTDLRIVRSILLVIGLTVMIIPTLLITMLHRIFEILDDFMDEYVQDKLLGAVDALTNGYARLRRYEVPQKGHLEYPKKACYPQDCDPDCPGEELPGPPRLIILEGDTRSETDEEYEIRTGRKPRSI